MNRTEILDKLQARNSIFIKIAEFREREECEEFEHICKFELMKLLANKLFDGRRYTIISDSSLNQRTDVFTLYRWVYELCMYVFIANPEQASIGELVAYNYEVPSQYQHFKTRDGKHFEFKGIVKDIRIWERVH